MKDGSLPDDGIDKVGVAIKLVLDQVVEHLQQEEDQVVVGGGGQKKPRGGEGLEIHDNEKVKSH